MADQTMLQVAVRGRVQSTLIANPVSVNKVSVQKYMGRWLRGRRETSDVLGRAAAERSGMERRLR